MTDFNDIQIAARGEIPHNTWNPYKGYVKEYIGTWPIQVATTIANQLRKYGWKVRVRGRSRNRRWHRYYYVDPTLDEAEYGAVYVVGKRKRKK